MSTISLAQGDTPAMQVVDRGLRDVVPIPPAEPLPLADMLRTSQRCLIGDMSVENCGQSRTGRALCPKESLHDPGNAHAAIIMLEGQMMPFNKRHDLTLPTQVAINEMQMCALSITNALPPYHIMFPHDLSHLWFIQFTRPYGESVYWSCMLTNTLPDSLF